MARINRDGKAYDSGDAVVTLLGIVEDEVSEISYSTSQEHQINHHLSRKGRSWSMGKITNEASITLSLKAGNAIEKAAKGSILNIKPFEINVTFVDEYNDIINDTIVCKFQKTGRQVNGEMGLEYQYELFVLDIIYNNA